jgi:hypothetical protein
VSGARNAASLTLRTGVHARRRRGLLESSHAAELVRTTESRARFHLPAAAFESLAPAVGVRLACELLWADGSITLCVAVYAVHVDRQLIDVSGYEPLDRSVPDEIRVRRFGRSPADRRPNEGVL